MPSQFEDITNQLQVCNWLVDHPDILRLANQMLSSKSQDIGTTSTMKSDNAHVSIMENFMIG